MYYRNTYPSMGREIREGFLEKATAELKLKGQQLICKQEVEGVLHEQGHGMVHVGARCSSEVLKNKVQVRLC